MSEARVVSRSSPYRGLSAFEDSDEDALFFFSRERETQIIAANVMASRFTVLYGPLGVGKSSVLRAGVVRRLRSLAPDAVVVVHDSWASDAGGLLDSLARTGEETFLVLDQFEELFVYPGAGAFAESLAEVVTLPDLRVNVLLALREDALSQLDVFTGYIPNVFGNYLALEPLDRAAARIAITGPIARYNELSRGRPVEIENDVVEEVLDQVAIGRVLATGANSQASARRDGAGRIEAAYLQLVMERLWDAEQERGSRVLRRATLEELGGSDEIVRAHLDEAIEALEPAQRDVAARVFNHLVTPTGTKIAHGPDDLAQYAGVGEDELLPVLASLGGRRIVRPVDGRIEIFHDVLANAVLAWRTRHDAQRELERQRASAERRHRRLLVLLVSSLVALIAMAAVTIYAVTKRSEAREQAAVARDEATRAKASELAAQASVLIPITAPNSDPELGLLLATEAARLSPNARTAGVLRRALLLSHLRAILPERAVTTGSFSPDGGRIVVGTESGARLYAADGRRALSTLQLGGPATGAAFSPDSAHVLTTQTGGAARLWEAETGREVLALGEAPESSSFSPDGDRIVTVEGGAAYVWDAGSGTLLATLRHPNGVQSASFGPPGTHVATIGAAHFGPSVGRTVARVFDAGTGVLIAEVEQGGEITSATLISGNRLLIAGPGHPVRVWSPRGGRLLQELPEQSASTRPAVVSPDGELLVTTVSDVARVWALSSGRLLTDLVGHRNIVDGVAFSRDGRSLATWDVDGTALIWEPARGSARVALAGHGAPVTGASFDASGDRVLTTSADGRARLSSARVQDELDLVSEVPGVVTDAAFSEDGRVAAVATLFEFTVVDASDGEEIATYETALTSQPAVSGDGSLVAASEMGRVFVWRVPDPDPIATLRIDGANSLAFSRDSSRLAVGATDGVIRVATLGRPGVVRVDGPARVTSVAFSPSAEVVVAGFRNGAVAGWRLDDRRRLFRRVEHVEKTPIRSIAFDAGGRRLTTAGGDSTVRVWDARTWLASYALRGHYGSVGDAEFSPDAEWIVSAGARVAGVWDLATRQRFLFLRGHEGRVLAASFDETGRRITTVGDDGTLRTYECEVCAGIPELLRIAESRVEATGRRLTAAERRRYLGE